MIDFIQLYFREMITAMIAGFGTWFIQRKQKHVELSQKTAELESLKANNSQKIMDMYQEALNDLKIRYDEKFSELHKEINILRRNVELWKEKYRDLKKEFEAYKKRSNGK